VEVSYSKDKPINKNNVISRIKEDLRNVGILSMYDKICVENVNDIEFGYPLYNKDYRIVREQIIRYLYDNNVIPCGRYGSWRYMSMEESILDGRNVIKEI
jgi:protoporphyrinogen oxidase